MAKIRPLQAIIAYVAGDADLRELLGGRIAAKHKFGLDTRTAWPTPSKALQLRLLPGEPPELDSPIHMVRIEARCYGESEDEADKVYQALDTLLEYTANNRVTASTGSGIALIYHIIPEGSPEYGFDPDVEVDCVLIQLAASVAKCPIG